MDTGRPLPVIIDTDFGGDPDDVIALVYALKSPEIEIKALLTNDEFQTNHRALVLRRWLKSIDRDIPVFSGRDLGNSKLFLLEDLVEPADLPAVTAPELKRILKKVSQEGGKYLSIGALSNRAELGLAYPNIWPMMETIIMGGAIHFRKPGVAEHNVRLDLSAARQVFGELSPKRWVLSDFTFVPQLSVTRQHDLYRHFQNRSDFFDRLIIENFDRFFDTMFPDSRMHDPLTFSTLFLPTVDFEAKYIELSSIGEFIETDHGSSTQVSVTADYDLFWSDLQRKVLVDG